MVAITYNVFNGYRKGEVSMDLSTKFHQADVCDNEGNVVANGYLWNDNGDYIEIRGKDFPILPEGEKMKIIAHHRNARSEIYTTVVYISRENYLSLYVISKTIESNQRKFYRIQTNIRADITHQIVNGSKISLKKPVEICVLDLSLGGFRFGSKTALEVGNRYRFDLLLGKNMADLTFKILRRLDSEKWGYEYGCTLKDLSQISERYLCQYIFDRERQQKAKINNILKKSIFIQ
jgi:c-di-GMP-binding flagellar brake protein YcgR